MLRYIRLFALSSLGAVFIIALVVGLYFRMQMSINLQESIDKETISMGYHFADTIWSKVEESGGKFVAPSLGVDAQEFAIANNVKGLRLYSSAGELLFTTEGTMPVAVFNQRREEILRRNLPVFSEMMDASASRLVAVADTSDRLMHSIVPLGNDKAYLELYTDITPQWKKLLVLQWTASGSVVTIFSIMLWVLLIITRKAEIIISRQHEVNAELAAAAASAQAENQAKSQFLANISHELRTPLNAIIGFSEIMKTDFGETTDGRNQDYINDIHSSGVHLLSLINDILDFSKADAGKLELEIGEVNVTKMITNCLRLVSPRAEAGNVTLINTMPKEQLVIETDSKKFKQVMLNLLSNAVKFTPAGGQVRVGAWHDVMEDLCIFEIRDTGIGMATKDLARAMAPFEQVDNALSRRYEGTGLGLPLTKKFIELMGGRFEMKSQPNIGTTVSFRLPRSFKPREGIIYKRIA